MMEPYIYIHDNEHAKYKNTNMRYATAACCLRVGAHRPLSTQNLLKCTKTSLPPPDLPPILFASQVCSGGAEDMDMDVDMDMDSYPYPWLQSTF